MGEVDSGDHGGVATLPGFVLDVMVARFLWEVGKYIIGMGHL